MSHGPLRPAPPLSVSADGDLLPLVRAGDEQAFSALVARYHKRLVRLAQSFVRTAASAEEVAQETWLAVLGGLDRFEHRSSFKVWLFRILMNRAKSRAEQEARSVPFSGLDAADEDPSLRDLAAQFGPDGRWLSPTRSWEQDTPEKLLLLRETRHTRSERGVSLVFHWCSRGGAVRCGPMQTTSDFDVVVIGGNLLGAMAAIMLQRRGIKTLVLEARPAGKEQKAVVGEAITEGSSVFLRHEIGLTDWLRANAFRKFGFDFLTLPRRAAGPGEAGPQSVPISSMEDCHELMLSTTPLEQIPGAVSRLIPTYHVERTGMNRHVVELAIAEGADYRTGANVEHVRFDEADPTRRRNEVTYSRGGETHRVGCRWVLDCSGRRAMLSRQLGLFRQVHDRLDTASVWNRFSGVESDPAIWRGFHGIDRRRHTIHMTGPGFWIWWIHQRDDLTSVGISFDNEQHRPDIKSEDRGFWEMMGKFPPVIDLLKRARPLEPYQYYAHLPYQSERWIDAAGYALIGDAAWFTDALYSIGIETGCRQLMGAIPLIVGAVRGQAPCEKELQVLNLEFARCQQSVIELNRFKYKNAWHRPHTLIQSAVYELGEIAELYYLRDKQDWRPEVLRKHYRLQWYSEARRQRLLRFLEGSTVDGERDLEAGAGLLKKALLPGPSVYRATWPLWQLRRGLPHFFGLIRGWAYLERMTQRHRYWPDGLHWMATSPHAVPPQLMSAPPDRRPAALAG